VFRVLERATDLLAVVPLDRGVSATRSLRPGSPPFIGQRTPPRRLVAIPIEPGPRDRLRAPWGEPDDPVPFVTIVTRRWPASKPLPGRPLTPAVDPVGSGAEVVPLTPGLPKVDAPAAASGRARPGRRRALTRLAMLGLALVASLVAAELVGRGRPALGSSRA
jgi:hypothetical protein